MLVLAIDTATPQLGLALARDGRVMAELQIADGLAHCERLIMGLDGILGDVGLKPAELEGVAVSVGPGSFTGLRIGVAAAQGLALAHHLPVAPVSTLEALAASAAGAYGIVIPCLDARRGEVYFSAYDVRGEEIERLCDEHLAPPAQVLKAFDADPADHWIVVGTGAERVLAACEEAGRACRQAPVASPYPRAAHVALLGERVLADGGGVEPQQVEPVYLRRSDAELHRQASGTPGA